MDSLFIVVALAYFVASLVASLVAIGIYAFSQGRK